MEQRDEVLQKGNAFTKTIRYLQRNGIRKTAYKVYRKLFQLEKQDYDRWRRENLPSASELAAQRETTFSDGPLFSILTPLYHTPPAFLQAMIESVKAQTYGKWELILVDGSGGNAGVRAAQTDSSAVNSAACALTSGTGETADAVAPYLKDSRIHWRALSSNLGIAGNTNEAMKDASGDYLVFLDHDDTLAENALFELAGAITAGGGAPDFLYSDEDKMSADGTSFFEPHFKPDFNPYLLESMNYICHLVCVKAELAREAGGLDPEFDGSQDYDFVFRCTEKAKKICHIPKVLYHWRSHEQSTAATAQSKEYTVEAGRRAVEAHLLRTGKKGMVKLGTSEGVYHVTYELTRRPLVSILIPNKDHSEDLEKCLASLMRLSYDHFEVIIIENNSTEEETFRTYEKWQKQDSRIRVVTYTGAFHYSKVNNFGASFAKGEYLLLLNNDIEWISADGLEELLGYGMQPGIGIVGAKLLYEDRTIQHAGIIVGIGGVAGHAFQRLPADERTYMWRGWCTQQLSAVTAACLLVKKSVFDELQGLDEQLAVAFNDVDFCLRAGAAGYGVIYNSEVLLYHYESKSRGQEDTPEKVKRFHREAVLFLDRWAEFLKQGDPFYNPNLTLEWQDFSCRSREEDRKREMDIAQMRENAGS